MQLRGHLLIAGVMASTDGVWSEDPTGLHFSGEIAERPVTAGSVSGDYTTTTDAKIQVTLDTSGRPASLEAHAVTRSTSNVYGYRQMDTWLTSLDTPMSTPPAPDPRSPRSAP